MAWLTAELLRPPGIAPANTLIYVIITYFLQCVWQETLPRSENGWGPPM